MSKERPFFEVNPHKDFGKLIRDWVSGTQRSRPAKVADLVRLMQDEYQVIATVPDEWAQAETEVTDVNYIELVDGKLNIILPTATMLKQGDDAIDLARDDYIFPNEYNDAYDGDRHPSLPKDTRKRIQNTRLADYCISICM
ncbi:hypothetical protein [Roseibium sp.]|uniref:hypothetical protein n=1 Tax=Roseibium sp. TaxID=1936156 RepID=UPI003A9691B2